METRYFHILTFSYTFRRNLLWIRGFGFIGMQFHTCFINFGLVKFREKNFSSNPCFQPNPRCSKLFAFKQLDCKSTSQQPATHYCTKLHGLKEKSVLGNVEILSFLNVIRKNIFLYCTTLILIYDVLLSFRLYYIQFKELKILLGPGARGRTTKRP